MEDEENISIENFEQEDVLEQQIQTYIIQIMNEDATKQEKIQHLHRIALIYEREEEKYKKLLIDPNTDKRYEHTIGRLINLFIENEEFVLQITDKWIRENDVDIHTALARLLFAVSVSSDRSFFVTNPEEDEERLMEKFQFWIRTPPNKALRVYGIGLLAHFIEESDLAGNTLSTDLPTVVLRRLNNYMSYMSSIKPENDAQLEADIEGTALQVPSVDDEVDGNEPVLNELHVSNASLNELEQICLLKYISDVGEFQEVLSPIIQHRGVDILLYYLKSRDPHVVGASLKAINQLLAHRKFGTVFVDAGGMKALIDIPKNEFYATLVSHCMGSIAGLLQAVEQICLLQEPLPQQLIEYVVWLVNNPNEVPKKDGSLFFTLTMRFRKIFELFTASEVPRQMIEQLKETLNKLTFSHSPEELMDLGDDENTLTRTEMQIVGSFFLTLREYVRTQLVYQTELWKRKNAQAHNKEQTPKKSKPVPVTPSYRPLKVEDETVNETIITVRDGNLAKAKFKEVEELVNLEGIIQALKVIEHNNNLCERELRVAHSVDNATVALDVLHVISATNYGQNELLNAKIGEKSAISILLDSVRELQYENPTVITVALKVLSNFVLKPSPLGINKQNKRQSIDPKLDEMTKQTCKTIRLNDGISVLLSLLKYRTSISDADTIRALACKVLTGLSKDTTIKQILNKKVTRTLPELTKEPVDRSNIGAFQQFKTNAKELIQAITGRDATVALADTDHALTKYEQAAIVAQTPIHYADNELLQLIHQHLTERGLEQTANTLLSEAKIPAPPKPRNTRKNRRALATPSKRSQMMEVEGAAETSDEDSSDHSHQPISQNRLDVIMKEYLMDQHRKCGHPCAVLPDFSLMNRHRCPEPIDSVHTGRAAKNIGTRLLHRQWRPVRGGYGGAKLDRRFKYSKFRPTRKVYDDGEMMTCCAVVDNGDRLLVGTPNGEVLDYDARTTQVVKLWEHVSETSVHSLKTVRGQNIVMSFSLSPNETKVFNTTNLETPLYSLPTMSGEFNNAGDRIVGVKAPGKVAVYDVKTGQELITLDDTSYNRTLAPSFPCFSPDDSLLLSSGVLWDYRHQRPIYRFDRFSNYGAEKFNPSGLDIIINSEIWDTRSFKLVKTCSALDQTSIVFSNKGDVIFAVPRPPVLSPENPYANFMKTLRVVDATDYELITELNHDKEIIDLTIDSEDSYLAMIESTGTNFEVHSMCRIWEIGRTRGVDDEDEWDEEDGEDDDDDEDGDMDEFDDMDLDDSDDEDAVEFFGDEDGEDDLEGFDMEDFDDDEDIDIDADLE